MWYDVKFIFLTWNCTWAVSLRSTSRAQQLIAFGAHICNWMSLVTLAEWGFVHSWVFLVLNYRNLSVLGLHQFPNKIVMELKAKMWSTLVIIFYYGSCQAGTMTLGTVLCAGICMQCVVCRESILDNESWAQSAVFISACNSYTAKPQHTNPSNMTLCRKQLWGLGFETNNIK